MTEPTLFDPDIRQTFYRWEDGHTYWQVDGSWLGAPTLKDGSPDVENFGYVRDFDLSSAAILALESYLDRRAADPDLDYVHGPLIARCRS